MEGGGLDVILFGFSFLAIGVLSRQFVALRGISLPVHVFMVLAGFILGIFAKLIPIRIDPLHLKDISPEVPFHIYLCILMFDCAFNTEVHYLKIMAYHMSVICIPIIVLMYLFICPIGVFFFPYPFTVRDYIILMSVIMTPGPHMTKIYLGPTNVQQDLKTLLEAEAVFGNYINYLIFRVAVTYHSYHKVVASVVLDILIDILVGFLVGKIIVYWISKIFKDYVNQMTIVLALIYAGFSLSFLMGSGGFLCVVTIGLVLSHRKSSMSTQFVQIMNSLLEFLLFFMTSVTCVSAGLYFATMVIQSISIKDVATTFAIFMIQSITRAIVLVVAFRYMARHLQTRTNAVIVWSCNIRGSYAIMMSCTLLSSKIHTSIVSKLFTLALMQILMSFMTNSIICSYVIGYLNEETLNKKRRMIERAARLMIEIRKSAVSSLRNAVSIADADWNVVTKQTKLKSDFMTAYRYAGWLAKPEKENNSSDVDPIIEMTNDAIRQITLSEKAQYTRLFGLGVLSRTSVINLMYLVTQCLKLKRLLVPKDIIGVADSASFLHRLELELHVMIRKRTPSIFIRILIFVTCFTDIFVVAYTIMYVLFDQEVSQRLYLVTGQNIMMILIYLLVFLFSIFKNRASQTKDIWQSLYKCILLVSMFDMLITAGPLLVIHVSGNENTVYEVVENIVESHYRKILVIMNIVCILTRLLRSIPLILISPMIQVYLLRFVTFMQDKKLFIQSDMAIGYLRVSNESLRKMSSIITDRHLVREFKYLCHRNRLEAAQYLEKVAMLLFFQGMSQLRHPNVMTALKTKIAMRLTLNAVDSALTEIKEMGIVGEIDASLIHKEISLKMMASQNFPYMLGRISVQMVIQNIPWLEGDLDLAHEIESRGHVIKFYSNDIILTQGHMPGGIFIILYGLVRVESVQSYEQCDKQVGKVSYYAGSEGQSFLSRTSLSDRLELHGFYTRGNIIGEAAFLNEKPGHKTYRCATYVEVLFVSSADLAELINRSSDIDDPLSPIELKMWRTVAIRQAVRIIHKGGSSSNMSRMTIFNRLAESYIIDGNRIRILTVSPNEVSAVILIQGYVSQFYSELRYVGPCILPYNQQKFISHPELGLRVIYLIIKSKLVEENTFEGLVPEEPQMANYEDSLTISSGSSDDEPYRRDRDDIVKLEDESDFRERMFASGMTQEQMKLAQAYKIRERYSFML